MQPETKLIDLIQAHPKAVEVLGRVVPIFQDPQVWRSVSKTATLGQISHLAGIQFAEFVQILRNAGVELAAEGEAAAAVGSSGGAERPAWVSDSLVQCDLNADSLASSGTHPLGAVRLQMRRLGGGRLVRLTSSDFPAPLIDALSRDGLRTHSEPVGDQFVTYIGKAS